MANELKLGDIIPLGLWLNTKATNKFVRVSLYGNDGIELAASPVLLTHLAKGFYRDRTIPMPQTDFVDCLFEVFDDAGLTTHTSDEVGNVETFQLSTLEESIDTIMVNIMADVTAKLVTDEPIKVCLEVEEPLEARLEAEQTLSASFVSEDEIAASTIPSIVEASERTLKSHRSAAAGTVAPFHAWAFNDLGDVVLADANIISLSDFAGINLSSIDFGNFGDFAKQGNAPGAAASLSATPGDYVYISSTPGDLTLTPPAGPGDIVFIVGRAEPGDGVTGAATDLYIEPQEQG